MKIAKDRAKNHASETLKKNDTNQGVIQKGKNIFDKETKTRNLHYSLQMFVLGLISSVST